MSRSLRTVIKQTISRWSEHEVTRLGAALAYYALLSLAPLVIFILAALSLAFGAKAVEERIVYDASLIMGSTIANTIKDLLSGARKPVQGLVASVIATLILVFGASAVFSELRDALHKIWGVKPRERSYLKTIFVQKLFAFALVLGAGALVLLSMLATAALGILGRYFGHKMVVPPAFLALVNFLISV